MNKNEEILNSLFVEVFNDILLIEQKTLKEGILSDLSVTEIHTIEAIGYNSSRTMSEIASDLNITVGTLTTAINKLIKKGYVERMRIESDRRVVLVNLTKKGKIAYRLHARFHLEMIKETTKSLTKEEEDVLCKALNNMKEFFKDKYLN
ncbi:MarR family winged helix-turn-helix transcriptional regulator [Clostridium mediterraneense]|uniref:MarR family winged helix-turn-helix transcriptional regulator n=1 Tax=Clostridium mediterraneense TaxID=1805472 RepID=UPI00083707A5|nr:MarR family transcriptional regulator [Clostridium mediterraneense]